MNVKIYTCYFNNILCFKKYLHECIQYEHLVNSYKMYSYTGLVK